MNRINPLAAVGVITLASSAALASAQIPTPANPFPDQPVATDGSPLPAQRIRNVWAAELLGAPRVGRSVVVEPRR